ncbi:VOC family protein [Solimicrobium silvestre]|uniref:Glyoxalase-like domain n=1 Tax=Solimicrobium silvestre TaxID=2099400 RepID=A0A2S9H2Y4_9BURK|nr:VOC family protein [Solimicrobium silvestre]PRC94341.1 Glyoxalase-like domain [Solimicrobium silvestre]
MLHHISLGVTNLAKAGAFYDAALAALDFRRVFEDNTAIGYGLYDGKDILCLKLRPNATPPGAGFHLALAAPSRAAVDNFHADALAIGGQDNGAPGLRLHYGADYYAAFLIDPDGYHIEAVCKFSLQQQQAVGV